MRPARDLYLSRHGVVSGPGDVIEFTPQSDCFIADALAAIASFFTATAPEDVAAAAAVTAPEITAGALSAADLATLAATPALDIGAGVAGAGATAAGIAEAAAPAIEYTTGLVPAGSDLAAGGAAAAAGGLAAGTGGIANAIAPSPAPGVSGALPTTPTPAAPAAGTAPSPIGTTPTAPSVAAPGVGSTSPGPVGGAVSSAAPSSVSSAASASPAEGVNIGGGTSSISSAVAPGAGTAPVGSITAPSITPTIDTAGLSATPALPGGSGGGIGGAISGAGKSVNSFFKDYGNVLGAGVGIAGLGLDFLVGNKQLPGQSQLTSNANDLNASAKALENYFTTGTLPPGVQASINQATASAKAAIRSQYASIDPGGTSSAMEQDLAAVDSRAVAQGSQIALNLLQQGVSEQGLADQIYTELMNNALTQDQQLGTAISSFASSLVPTTVLTAAQISALGAGG